MEKQTAKGNQTQRTEGMGGTLNLPWGKEVGQKAKLSVSNSQGQNKATSHLPNQGR
jgi:hypothetical protein